MDRFLLVGHNLHKGQGLTNELRNIYNFFDFIKL
jgi:hypothetical protein